MSTNKTSPCRGTPYDLAAPFIGTWQEFTVTEDGQELLEGTLISKFAVDGCVLTQSFTSVDGSFSFLSFAYVEAATNCWAETYVFNNGRATQWRWVPQADELIIEHVSGDQDVIRRLRVVNHTQDSYDVIEEKRESTAQEWTFVVLTKTRRVE